MEKFGIDSVLMRELRTSKNAETLARDAADEPLEVAIRAAIGLKPKGHDFDYSRQKVDGQVSRHMSHTGG